MLIIQLLGKVLMLRGSQEVNFCSYALYFLISFYFIMFFAHHAALTCDNILLLSSPNGEFAGRKIVEVVIKLRLGNTSRRLVTGKRDMVGTSPEGNILYLTCRVAEFRDLCHPDQKRVYCFQKMRGR